MPYDHDKLARLIMDDNPHQEAHLDKLESAIKVMTALDNIKGAFDISSVEVAGGGPYTSIESARIAKMILACHDRGQEWVKKWNTRVAGRTPDAEREENEAIIAARSGRISNPVPSAELLAAKDKIAVAEAKVK